MLFVLILGDYISILILNNGHFIFTLDDPYIHLKMAENIMKGHYGININEFSSPSSSILWTFILAPFTLLNFEIPAVLLINIISSFLILFLYWKILSFSFDDKKSFDSNSLTLLLIILIPSTNLVGLIFTGMEHSLHLLFSILIVYGLLLELKTGKIYFWLPAAIVISPLIRYEGLAIAIPAIFYLYIRGYKNFAVYSFGAAVLVLVTFSYYLQWLGLPPFPTSIIAKSSLVFSQNQFDSSLSALKFNISTQMGKFILLMILILLVYTARYFHKKAEIYILILFLAAGVLHLFFGKIGSFNRYEIYIWAPLLILFILVYKDDLIELKDKININKFIFAIAIPSAIICFPYYSTLVTTPLASNNIYCQQFQMARFAEEFYKKPVAVNDIGLVSYRNPNYVLDLWGLGSNEALSLRNTSDNINWMTTLAKKYNVHFAMIYESWFKIPPDWIKLGELEFTFSRITPALKNVSFFALDRETFSELLPILKKFNQTLPSSCYWHFSE